MKHVYLEATDVKVITDCVNLIISRRMWNLLPVFYSTFARANWQHVQITGNVSSIR